MNTDRVSESPWSLQVAEYPGTGHDEEKLHFLVRYAILAPSVHNTQPWAFAIDGNSIRVFADQTRCLRSADQDMRDIYVSLGSAIENLVIAAEHFGFRTHVEYNPSRENPLLAASVELSPDGIEPPSEVYGLFRAITVRRTNHDWYSLERVSEHDIHHLTACCTDHDVAVELTSNEAKKKQFGELLLQADVIRFSDPAYVRELEYWVRQGAYDVPWMIKKLHELASALLSPEQRRSIDVLRGAPLLGLVSTETNDRASQIRSGRAFERLFLRATALGLSVEPITYVLQVPETRTCVSSLLRNSKSFPQVAFRLGFSTVEPNHSPRRPLSEVLIKANVPMDPPWAICSTEVISSSESHRRRAHTPSTPKYSGPQSSGTESPTWIDTPAPS